MGQHATAQDGQLSQARRAFDQARLAFHVAAERARLALAQGQPPNDDATVAAWSKALAARQRMQRIASGYGLALDLSTPRNALFHAPDVTAAAQAIVSGEVITARQLAEVSQ